MEKAILIGLLVVLVLVLISREGLKKEVTSLKHANQFIIDMVRGGAEVITFDGVTYKRIDTEQ